MTYAALGSEFASAATTQSPTNATTPYEGSSTYVVEQLNAKFAAAPRYSNGSQAFGAVATPNYRAVLDTNWLQLPALHLEAGTPIASPTADAAAERNQPMQMRTATTEGSSLWQRLLFFIATTMSLLFIVYFFCVVRRPKSRDLCENRGIYSHGLRRRSFVAGLAVEIHALGALVLAAKGRVAELDRAVLKCASRRAQRTVAAMCAGGRDCLCADRALRKRILRGTARWALACLTIVATAIMGMPVSAATLYWDNDGNAANNSLYTGVGLGGAGTWDQSATKWWNGTADVAWSNTGLDTAVFWGTAGTVTLGEAISVGGLTFNTTGYTITGNTLSFGGANNVITMNNIAATTIASAIAGANPLTISGGIYGGFVASTVTMTGTGTGFTGATTINNGMTLLLSGTSGTALSNTSGITLNGGGLSLTNTTVLERVNNAANITANGGTITLTNTSGANVYNETLGVVALTTGQLNFVLATNQASTGSQTLTLSGLTRTGTTNNSAVTFSAAATGPATTKNMIVVNGAVATTAGQIIGPWATVGTTAALQTDYAVYNASSQVVPANITASADSTWTNTANAYTTNTASLTLGATAHNMAALRNTAATATITIPTSGNLNTYGLLNGVATTLTIAATGTGALSTPAGGGFLFVNTGSAAITINAPINDNSGAVTLVRTGTGGALTLGSTTSNYTGGTVIDAAVAPTIGSVGTAALNLAADTNLGATSGGITFNASGTIVLSAAFTFNAGRTITINNGALAKFDVGAFNGAIAGKITGTGGLILDASSGDRSWTLSNTTNDFQGPLMIGFTTNTVIAAVASLADSTSANGAIRLQATTGGATFQWSTAATAPLTLNNRQIDLMGSGGTGTIENNNATAANAITINTDLLVSATGAKILTLQGSNTGSNAFVGKIVDGAGAAVVSLLKAGAGTWTLSNNNTYTGTTTVSAGNLIVTGQGGAGTTSIAGGATFRLSGSGVVNGAVVVNPMGTLTVDNTASLFANRLNAKDLTLNGGTFNYVSGTGASTDNVNGLTLAATSTNFINLTANATGVTTVTAASVTRNVGGTLFLSGANLGAAAGANNANLILTTIAGAADVVGGTGGAGTTTISINPYIVGQDTAKAGNAQYGFMTAKINGTVLTSGLRTLTAAEYATSIAIGATTTDNVSLIGIETGIDSATTINVLRLDAGAGVDGNGTLTVTSGAVLALTGTSAVGISTAVLDFGAREAIFQTVATDLNVAAVVTGSVGITKSGSGVLSLNNANLFSGPTSIAQGVLRLGSTTALTGSTAVTTANYVGVLLDLNGFSTTIGSLAGGGTQGGNVNLNGANLTVGSDNSNTTYAGLIFGAGAVVKTGNGTLTLASANTYAGATTIESGGTLVNGIAASLPAATALTVNSGAVFDLNAGAVTIASLSGAGTVTNTTATARALTVGNFAGSVDTTFSGVFNATTAANLTLTKTGGGTLTLTAAAPGTANGAWTLNAGTIKADYSANSATANIINPVAMTLQGGSINITGRSGATVTQTLGAITVGARGTQITIVPNGGTSTTLSLGTLIHPTTAGASLLVNAPTGTTVTTSTAGTLTTIFGGRFVFTDGTAYDWATNNGASTAIVGYANANYVALDVTAGTDTNNSTLTDGTALTGAATSTRITNTLKILTTTDGQSLALADKNLQLTAGGLLFTGANAYMISGTTGALSSSTATNSDLIVHQYGTGDLTIGAIIANGTGASTLTKVGFGKLILTGVNSYTGATSINGGILSISNNNQLGATATAAITINDGATLQTTATLSTGTHTYALPGGTAAFDVGSGTTMTVNGVISGAGGLTLTNSQNTSLATLTLTAAATYTGPTFVTANTKLLGGVATSINAGTGGNLNVATGGLVDLGNFTMTVGGIAGTGNIVNSGATAGTVLTIGGNNQSSTYSGVLQASGTAANLALTKTGTGVLTLGAVNLYTGATLLANGTIRLGVDNALAAATPLTLGNAAGPVGAALDLNGKLLTLTSTTPITFYGTTSTATSQATINIGTGGNLTLGGNVASGVNATAANGFLGAQILGGTLTMTAVRTFTIVDSINAAADLMITSNLVGTGGGILKAGTGNMLLMGQSSLTGASSVTVGTLTLGADGALSPASAMTIAATAATATLDLGGTTQTLNGVLTLSGTTAVSVPVVNLSGGTLTVLGGITYTATGNSVTAQINGGTLDLGSATRTLTVGNSTTQALDLAISSVFSGTGGLSIAGVGQLLLSGASTYSGDTTMTAAGIVQAGIDNALPFGGGKGNLIINAGTFDLNGRTVNLNAFTSNLAAGIVDNAGASAGILITGNNDTSGTVFAGSIQNTGAGALSLSKIGTGAQTLTGTVSLNGALTASAGTLLLTGALSNVTSLNAGGGTLIINGVLSSPNLITSVAVGPAGQLALRTGAGAALPNLTSLSLTGGVLGLEAGTSTSTLTSSNAALTSGNITLNVTPIAGITTGTSYSLLAAPSGLNSATYKILLPGYTFTSSIADNLVSITPTAAVTGDFYWNGSQGNSWTTLVGGTTSNFTTTPGGPNTGTTPGAANTVVFSDSNQTGTTLSTTLDANVTINNLVFNANVGSGPLGTINIASGVGNNRLTLAPASSADGILLQAGAPNVNISAVVNLGGSQTWTVTSSGTTLTLNNAITGAAGVNLTKAGLGTLVLGAASAFGGVGTTVAAQEGTLQFDNDNRLGNSLNVLSIGGSSTVGTLKYVGASATIGRNITLGTVAASTTGQTVSVAPGTILTLSGIISGGPAVGVVGNTGLTVAGGGTLVLTGNNTFTGDVVVGNNSTLSVNTILTTLNLGTALANSAPKTVFVQSGGTYIATASQNPVAFSAANSIFFNFGTSGGGASALNVAAGIWQLDDAGQLTLQAAPWNVNVAAGATVLLGSTSVGYDVATVAGLNTGVLAGASVNVTGAGTFSLRSNAGTALGGVNKAPITLNTGTTLDLRQDSPTAANAIGNRVTIAGNATITSGRNTAAAANITQSLGLLSIGGQTLTHAVGNGNTAPGVANLNFTSTTLTGNPTFNLNYVNGAGIGTLGLGALNDGGTPRTITLTTTGSPSALSINAAPTSFTGTINVTNGTYLVLGAAGANTGTTNVLNGSVVYTATGANATGTVNVGDTSGSAPATLSVGANGAIVDNAFVIRDGSAGITTINTVSTATVAAPNLNGFGMGLGGVGTISAPITLAKSTGAVNFGAAANTTLVITGAVGESGGAKAFNMVGPGNVYLLGDKAFSGGLNITGGALVLGASTTNFTGTTTINGGSIALLGTYAVPGAITVGAAASGSGLIYLPGAATTDYSSSLAMTAGGNLTIDVVSNATSVTYNTAFGSSVSAGLNKVGQGTLTLTPASGSNTFTGPTTAGAGTLALTFRSGGTASNIVSSSTLQFQGGTLTVNGGTATTAVSQTFTSTAVQAGNSTITLTKGGASSGTTLTLGAITRTGAGTMTFSTIPASTSINIAGTANNAAGILGGWAVIKTSATLADWATNSSNLVAAYTGYLGMSNANANTGTTATNFNIVSGTITPTTNSAISVNSLRFQANTTILALGAANSLTINGSNGGLLYALTSGTGTISGTAAVATGLGMVSAGTATGGELPIFINAGGTLTISAGVGGIVGTTNGFGLTVSGGGTLNLTNAVASNLNNFAGPIVLNGAGTTLVLTASNQVGSTAAITLNGGTINSNNGSSTTALNLTQSYTLGLNGGTLLYNATGVNSTWGATATPVAFLGSGSRTLTLGGTDTGRIATFAAPLGDGGGPTSLVVNGGNDTSAFSLSGANTYSGSTTLNRGVLINSNASGVPNQSNLVFNGGASTNVAVLELTATSGIAFSRGVGIGPNQVQWLGNGGFSAGTGTNTATPVSINLGGTGADVVWGSGGFVPSGSILIFNQLMANSPSIGAIDFQNGINFGSLTTRTIDVQNSTYSFNLAGAAATATAFDARLSGNLTSTSTGGFTKTGAGTLWITGNNSGFLGSMTIANGFALFEDTTALPANFNKLTVSTTTTPVGGVGAVMLSGQTNFNTLYSYLTAGSDGELALDTNSSENINFNAAGFANARFGTFGTVLYQGQFMPGTNGVYKLNGAQGNNLANSAGLSTLVLPRQNFLSGTSSTLDIGTGIVFLGSSNTFGDATHGTTLQSLDVLGNGAGGNSAIVMITKNDSLGSGPISLINAQAGTAVPALVVGAAFGDRTLANNIVVNNTGGISNLPFVLSGDTATDLVPSAGRITYTGSLNFSGVNNLLLSPRTTGFTLNGKVSGSSILHLSGGQTLVVFNNTSASPSDFTSSTLFLSNALTFLIGHASDLGDSATAGRVVSFNSNAVLGILPGAGDITTTGNITVTSNNNNFNHIFDVPLNQTLTLTAGVVQASARTGQLYTKTGAGTFDIGAILNPNAGASTYGTAGITIAQGTLRANFASAGAPASNIIALAATGTAGAPITFTGGTLQLIGKSATVNTQAFGTLVVSAGASGLVFNSTGATLTTTFATMGTRTAGSTLAITLPTLGGLNITAGMIAQGTLLVDSASTKTPFAVFGAQGGAITDWAGISGTSIAAPTYTPTTSTTLSGNATVATGVDTTLAAGAAADSVRFNLAEARTINLGGNTLNVGGILITSAVGANASTISSGSISTASGAAAGADLVIYQDNGTTALTIGANIVNNGANSVSLTKSGSGLLILNGVNTYSGNTSINQGSVTIASVAALGSGAGSITFGGSTLRYTGTGDAGSAGSLTNPTVSIARSSTIVVDSGANLTLAGTVSGQLLSPIFQTLTKSGAGTLTLEGNTVNSNLRVDVVNGTLVLNKSGGTSNAVGVFATNVLSNIGLTVQTGATVQLGGDTISGDQILNSSSVQLFGTASFDLNGHNETIDGLGGASTSTITNTNGGSAVLTVGFNTMVLGAPTQFDGTIQDGVGTTGLTMMGGNTFTLTGTNTYTGKTTITGQQYLTTGLYYGGISIASASNLGSNPANFTADQWSFNGGRLVMTDNVVLDVARNNVGLTLGAAGGGVFEVAANKIFTIGGANIIAGSGSFTQEGSGTIVILGGANTYTGKTILNAGVLSISSQGALGNNPVTATADQLTFNGGKLITTASVALSDSNRGVTIGGFGGTLAPAVATTLTLPNVITGTGDLTINGAGTVVLGGVNTPWSGKTILAGGELQISANTNLGTPPSTAVADQLQISNNAVFHLTASVTFNANRGVTIGAGGATITTDAATMTTLPGVVSLTSGTLTKNGTGILALSGTNTAASGTIVAIAAGVLRLSGAGALSTNSNLNIFGSGVVELGAANFTLALGAGDNQVQFTGSGGFSAFGGARNVNFGGAGTTVTWNAGSFVPTGASLVLSSATSDNTVTLQNGIDLNGALRTVEIADGAASIDAVLAGVLSDSGIGGGLVKTGAGTLSVTALGTYGGATQLTAGRLQAGAADVFSHTSAFVLTNGAGVVLGLNNTNQTVGSLAGGGALGGNVDTGSGAGGMLTAGDDNTTTVYAGVISGNGGLIKSGSGTLSLSSNQSYTGATSITGSGKLYVNALLTTSGIAVGAGATLGGGGTVSTLTTVAGTGAVTAGDLTGNGSLNLTGGLTLSGLATINLGQIADPGANLLHVGALIASGSAGTVILNVVSNSPINGYTNASPYTLLTYTGGSIGGTGFSAFALGTIAGTNSRTSGQLNDTGSSITLTLTADNPKWTGFDTTSGLSSSRWHPNDNSITNWKLISAGSPTDYIEGDVVLFDDTATGSTTVDISDGNVNPSSVTFNFGGTISTYALTGSNGIAGTANLNKSGVGTLVINNTNTFTGGILFNGGVIRLGSAGALGNTNGLTFGPNVASGTKLQLNGTNLTLSGLDTNVVPGSAVVENGAFGNAVLTLNLETVGTPASGSPHSVFAGVLQDGSTGSLGLTLSGDGSLLLTGTNTASGLTTIGSGTTLQIGAGGTIGSIAGTGGITNNGALIFNRSDSYSYSGNITGTGTTLVTGGGTLTLSGSLGSTGGTTIDVIAGNTLRVGNGGAGGSIAGAIVDNGTLIFNTTNTALLVAGSVTGSGSLTQANASGRVILAGTNNYGGGTTISAGILQIGNGGTTGSIVGDVQDDGVLAFSRLDNIAFTGNITGLGSVLVDMAAAAATLTLSGTNNYGGGVVLRQGVLKLGSASAVPSGSSITIGGTGVSGTLDLNGQNLTFDSLTTAGTASAQTITNDSALTNSILTYNGVGNSVFGGLIKNGASKNIALSVVGGGSLSLTNTNTYSGGTTIASGTVKIGADGGIGSGALTLGATGTDGTFDLGGFNQTVASLVVGTGATPNNQLVGNSSTSSGSVLTINGASTFAGIIQDTLGAGNQTTGLTIASATTVLTNTNTYTGATTINSGATLQIGTGGTTGALNSSTAINDNGALAFNRSDVVTVGAVITGSGGLQQIGSGTIELTGASSYGGVTVMNNAVGTLKLSGTNNSAGGTTLTAGTLLLNNNGANNGGLAGGLVTITSGTIDNVSGAALTLSQSNNVTVGGSFNFTGSNDLNFGSGSVNNAVAAATITIGGTGRTLTFGTMTNTANAINTLTVNGAGNTLVLAGYALSNNATSRVDVIQGTADIVINGPVINGGTSTAGGLNHTGATTMTLNGANNYGGLTTQTTAGGSLVFNGSNSGTGGTTLTAGTIQFGGAVNGGIATVGLLTLTAGALQAIGAPRTVSNPISYTLVTVSGSQSLSLTGNLTVVSAANRVLTSSITGGGLLTLGNIFLSDSATVAGGITIAGTGLTTVGGNIADFNGSGVASPVSVTNTNTTTLNGANTYAGLTTMSAATGTLILGGSNNSAGATTLTTGTLQLNSAANGGLASGVLTLTAGTLTPLNASRAISNAVTLQAVTVSGTENLTINGKVTGLTGAARTLLNNLAAGKTLVLGAIDINTETANARTLTIGGTGATTINGVIANGNGTTANGLTITSTGTTTITGTSNSYTGTTTAAAGTLVLGAVNTLPVANAFVLGTLGVNGVAATLDMTGFNQTVGNFSVVSDTATADQILTTSARTLTINGTAVIGSSSAGLTTTNLATTGGGSLVFNGTTFTVGGYAGSTAGQGNIATADFSGLSSVSLTPGAAGTIRVNNNSGSNTSGSFATLILPTTGSATSTFTVGTLAVGDGGQYNGTAGQVNKLKLGSGTNTLNVNTINIGTGTRDLGSITFGGASGTVKIRTAADPVSGRAAFNMGTGGSSTGVALNGNQNVFDVTGHSADLLLAAVNIGTQASRGSDLDNVFSFDTGTLDMTSLTMSTRSTSSFTTTTTFTIGGTAVVNSGAIAMSNSTVVGGTATSFLNLNGGTTTLTGAITRTGGNGTSNATLKLAGGTLNMSGNAIGGSNAVTLILESGTLQNVGQINAGAAITKTTGGTLFLTGTNGYSGAININGGTVSISTADALGLTPGVFTSSQLSLDNGTLATTGNVAFDVNRGITLNAGGGTFNIAAATTLTLGTTNIIAGTVGGTLTKQGAGTMIVNSASTYDGATNVNAGVLSVNGTLGTGAVIVGSASDATLNGSGTIGGALTVTSKGTFSAGSNASGDNNNGVGQVTVATGANWQTNSTFVFDFARTDNGSVTAGSVTNWDYINIASGGLALGSNLTLSIRSWTDATGVYGANSVNPFDPNQTQIATGPEGALPGSDPANYRWLWVSGANVADSPMLTQFSNIDTTNFFAPGPGYVTSATNPYVPNMTGGHFWVSAYQNDLYINYSAVPEPGSLLLVGLAGLGFSGYRRRKRRATAAAENKVEETAVLITREIV